MPAELLTQIDFKKLGELSEGECDELYRTLQQIFDSSDRKNVYLGKKLDGEDVGVGRYTNDECNDKDRLQLFLKIKDNRITDAGFLADSCVNAKIITELTVRKIIGMSLDDAIHIDISDVHRVLTCHIGYRRHCAILINRLIEDAVGDYKDKSS